MYATLPLPREAVVYFVLNFEDYNYEEDHGESPDADYIMAREKESMQSLRDGFGLPVYGEGHEGDSLICKVFPNTSEDLIRINETLTRRHIGGADDEIDAGADYVSARDFRFYPNGVNAGFYGEEPGAIGPWSEWISQHSQDS